MSNCESTKMIVEQLNPDCIVIDLNMEYGEGYLGTRYGVISEYEELPKEIIERLKKYIPYTLFPKGFKKVFSDFKRNEKTFSGVSWGL